jgi:hypothetical protein
MRCPGIFQFGWIFNMPSAVSGVVCQITIETKWIWMAIHNHLPQEKLTLDFNGLSMGQLFRQRPQGEG